MQDVRRSWASGLENGPFLLGSSLLVLFGLLESLVLRQNTERVAGLFYATDSLTLLACAWACLRRARSATHSFRLRWILLAMGMGFATLGYLISIAQSGWTGAIAARAFQICCFTASEATYLLAVVLFFSSARKTVVVVDSLQALLFVVLRFSLTYNFTTGDYATGHLQIGLLVALFLFLVTIIAFVGAVTETERRFLRILSWFFGIRYLGFFLSNQVAFLWLGSMYTSPLDVVGPTALALFALFLHTGKGSAQPQDAEEGQRRTRSIMVRNLMPSFLALVNVMLGVFTFSVSKPLAAAGLALTLVFYVARTTLLQNQALAEQAALQIRNKHLEGLTTLDPLTGVGNRRSLEEACARLLGGCEEGLLALLLIDIDHFKEANDRFGHLHGDRVLIALGETLREFAGLVPQAHCARFGGDEFALLLPDISIWRASALAEELRSKFAAHRFDAAPGTTLSMGIAVTDGETATSLDSLIASADAALYRAKLQGRNCVAAA